MEDPFYVVRDELQQSYKGVENLFEKWKKTSEKLDAVKAAGAVAHGNSVNVLTNDFKWTTNEIKNNIKSMEWDLKDLEETIKIVESNPQKFQGLSATEIASRKEFVRDLRAKLNTIKDTVNTEQTAEKAGLPKRAPPPGANAPASLAINIPVRDDVNLGGGSGTGFTDLQTQMIMQNQDDQLDAALSTIGVLKQQGHVIGKEIDDQAVLLKNMDEHIDNTQAKMDSSLNRMGKIIKQATDSKSSICIYFLIVILIFLLIFLLFW